MLGLPEAFYLKDKAGHVTSAYFKVNDAQYIELIPGLKAGDDRDGEGEYFQFYSRAVAKRIFFEVVERRAYDAYGAANASVRLNAQATHRDPMGL